MDEDDELAKFDFQPAGKYHSNELMGLADAQKRAQTSRRKIEAQKQFKYEADDAF
jgi:hypothetical protein